MSSSLGLAGKSRPRGSVSGSLWQRNVVSDSPSARNLEAGGNAAHGEPDEPLEVLARCVPGGERPEPRQAADLELGEGVDVGVAELDRAGDGRRVLQEPAPAGELEDGPDRAFELGFDRGPSGIVTGFGGERCVPPGDAEVGAGEGELGVVD